MTTTVTTTGLSLSTGGKLVPVGLDGHGHRDRARRDTDYFTVPPGRLRWTLSLSGGPGRRPGGPGPGAATGTVTAPAADPGVPVTVTAAVTYSELLPASECRPSGTQPFKSTLARHSESDPG